MLTANTLLAVSRASEDISIVICISCVRWLTDTSMAMGYLKLRWPKRFGARQLRQSPLIEGDMTMRQTMRQRTGAFSGAIAAIAMIAAQIGPAAAFSLPSPSGVGKAVSP
jgi:hypothetical protein